MSNPPSPALDRNGLIAVRRSTHSAIYTLVGALILVVLLTAAPWICLLYTSRCV